LHRLRTATVSVDSSVAVDFHLTGNLTVFETMFAGRMLLSDFVENELSDAEIHLGAAQLVPLSTEEEWDFFNELRKRRKGLGSGELGAITVARFREATLLTNDRQARLTAEQEGIPVAGAIGVLECALEIDTLSPKDAVRILEDMVREGAWISDELLDLFRQKILDGAV
jgi:predicted nucleic acid-binding protein